MRYVFFDELDDLAEEYNELDKDREPVSEESDND